jgi:hypothetical protein
LREEVLYLINTEGLKYMETVLSAIEHRIEELKFYQEKKIQEEKEIEEWNKLERERKRKNKLKMKNLNEKNE